VWFPKEKCSFLVAKCVSYSKLKSMHCPKIPFLSEARNKPEKEDMLLAEITTMYKTIPPSVPRQLEGWSPGKRKQNVGEQNFSSGNWLNRWKTFANCICIFL